MSSVPSALTFDEFYREAFPQGIRFLRYKFGLPLQDSEEVVQSTLVHFWEDHPDLAHLDRPMAYFMGYLRHFALQVVTIPMARPVTFGPAFPSVVKDRQWESLDQPLAGQYDSVVGDLFPSGGASVEAVVMARLRWQEVCAWINTLPLPQRVMFSLLVCGYTVPEIALRLRKRFGYGSFNAVRQQFAQVRRTLRQQTQAAKVQAQVVRAKANRPWSAAFPACQRCGTTTIKHRAYGYCYGCFNQVRTQLRHAGIEQRKKQYAWSRAFPACVGCGTTEIRHRGRGYCVTCYYRLFGQKQIAG